MLIEGLPSGIKVYEASVRRHSGATFALLREGSGEKLLYVSDESPFLPGGRPLGEGYCHPLTPRTAFALRHLFPWLSPQRIPADRPSFGFGDRIGTATAGHIRSLFGTRVFPILAQQSVRENARTGRAFTDVLASAIFGVFQEGYEGGFGADADHLKCVEDAIAAADIGYSFFTCDPSEHVVDVSEISDRTLRERFSRLPLADVWRREYLGRPFTVAGIDDLRFTEDTLFRAAIKYQETVAFASRMYDALVEHLPEGFDFEVSVDESEAPTSPLEHLFVSRELRRQGVNFVSLAPRFAGAMEKGVDWRGDLERFRSELRTHAAIAREIGPYRLSLHSGSDKFSLYPLLAEEAAGMWHVKTAGTSYLVGLDTAAQRDPGLFREIVRFSISQFAHERASYHISADPASIPPLASLPDNELRNVIEEHDGRQVLHVTFGAVLRGPLGDKLRLVLDKWEEEHYEGLSRHLGRHLKGLGAKNEE